MTRGAGLWSTRSPARDDVHAAAAAAGPHRVPHLPGRRCVAGGRVASRAAAPLLRRASMAISRVLRVEAANVSTAAEALPRLQRADRRSRRRTAAGDVVLGSLPGALSAPPRRIDATYGLSSRPDGFRRPAGLFRAAKSLLHQHFHVIYSPKIGTPRRLLDLFAIRPHPPMHRLRPRRLSVARLAQQLEVVVGHIGRSGTSDHPHPTVPRSHAAARAELGQPHTPRPKSGSA